MPLVPTTGLNAREQVTTRSFVKDVTVLESLARISTLIFRYSVFEEIYLRGSCPVQGRTRVGLERALKNLYTVIMLFLLKAHKYVTQNSAKRFLKASVSSEDLEKLSKDILSYEAEIHRFELLELRNISKEQYVLIRTSLSAYNDHLLEEQREKILD